MKVSVYDTYVRRTDGRVMHFDILVPDSQKDVATIHGYGHAFLKSKGQEGTSLGTRECRFCHVEQATAPMVKSIDERGYYIIEMENC
ncbi:MAG: DUF2024 family protein [Prosthecobacter sp.]|uniref:DUF2024 family protein n=1 Tax=Prosthecobacter sp. TaxID=1965333 RepID=UPI0038FEBBF8